MLSVSSIGDNLLPWHHVSVLQLPISKDESWISDMIALSVSSIHHKMPWRLSEEMMLSRAGDREVRGAIGVQVAVARSLHGARCVLSAACCVGGPAELAEHQMEHSLRQAAARHPLLSSVRGRSVGRSASPPPRARTIARWEARSGARACVRRMRFVLGCASLGRVLKRTQTYAREIEGTQGRADILWRAERGAPAAVCQVETGTPKHVRFYKHDDFYQRKRFNPLLCGVKIDVRTGLSCIVCACSRHSTYRFCEGTSLFDTAEDWGTHFCMHARTRGRSTTFCLPMHGVCACACTLSH
jgi:hypothetical protein